MDIGQVKGTNAKGKKGKKGKGKEKGKGALSVPNGTSIYVRVALQHLNQANRDWENLIYRMKLRKKKNVGRVRTMQGTELI